MADRMRPETLEEFLGQDEIVGQGKMLRQAIEADKAPSMIFWGPPGSGKTTLAYIVAEHTKAEFIRFSAVTSGVKDLKEVIKKARENAIEDKKTILFIDEIHRWNKAQQDALLPHVERGVITLIGATTENPSFEVRGALLSRCRVFVLKQLSVGEIIEIIKSALKDKLRGLGELAVKINDETISLLAQMSNGDARTALNVLEYAALTPHTTLSKGGGEGLNNISSDDIKQAFQKSYLLYDKDGEEHYNIISALHKSLRGSNADAALYWLARRLQAGRSAT